jgi:hypothetical protein
MNTLFWKKLAVAFAVGFGGVFIPAILTILDKAASGTPQHFTQAFVIGIISGAFAAGLRAALALSPWNFIPSDAEDSIGRKSNNAPPPATK